MTKAKKTGKLVAFAVLMVTATMANMPFTTIYSTTEFFDPPAFTPVVGIAALESGAFENIRFFVHKTVVNKISDQQENWGTVGSSPSSPNPIKTYHAADNSGIVHFIAADAAKNRVVLGGEVDLPGFEFSLNKSFHKVESSPNKMLLRAGTLRELDIEEISTKDSEYVLNKRLTIRGIAYIFQSMGKSVDAAQFPRQTLKPGSTYKDDTLQIRSVSGGNFSDQVYIVKLLHTNESYCIKGYNEGQQAPQIRDEILNLEQLNRFFQDKEVGRGATLKLALAEKFFFFHTDGGNKKYFSVFKAAQGTEMLNELDKALSKPKSWVNMMEDLGESLGQFHYKSASKRTKAYLYKNVDSRSLDLSYFKTVTHGDLHFGNVFYDEKKRVVTLIDINGMAQSIAKPMPVTQDIARLYTMTKYKQLLKEGTEDAVSYQEARSREFQDKLKLVNYGFLKFADGYAKAFPPALRRVIRNSVEDYFKKMISDLKTKYYLYYCNDMTYPEKENFNLLEDPTPVNTLQMYPAKGTPGIHQTALVVVMDSDVINAEGLFADLHQPTDFSHSDLQNVMVAFETIKSDVEDLKNAYSNKIDTLISTEKNRKKRENLINLKKSLISYYNDQIVKQAHFIESAVKRYSDEAKNVTNKIQTFFSDNHFPLQNVRKKIEGFLNGEKANKADQQALFEALMDNIHEYDLKVNKNAYWHLIRHFENVRKKINSVMKVRNIEISTSQFTYDRAITTVDEMLNIKYDSAGYVQSMFEKFSVKPESRPKKITIGTCALPLAVEPKAVESDPLQPVPQKEEVKAEESAADRFANAHAYFRDLDAKARQSMTSQSMRNTRK